MERGWDSPGNSCSVPLKVCHSLHGCLCRFDENHEGVHECDMCLTDWNDEGDEV